MFIHEVKQTLQLLGFARGGSRRGVAVGGGGGGGGGAFVGAFGLAGCLFFGMRVLVSPPFVAFVLPAQVLHAHGQRQAEAPAARLARLLFLLLWSLFLSLFVAVVVAVVAAAAVLAVFVLISWFCRCGCGCWLRGSCCLFCRFVRWWWWWWWWRR